MKENIKILCVAPPYRTLPSRGYGGIEKRALCLSKLGFKIDFIAAEGSYIDFSTHIYRCKRLTIRVTHKDLASCKSFGEKVLNYIKFLSDTRAFSYFKVYSDCVNKNMVDLDEYNMILNDAFRNEVWNSLFMHKLFPMERTIHFLHAMSSLPFWTNMPNFFKLKIQLGCLNRDTYFSLRNRGYKSFYTPNGIIIPDDRDVEEPEDFLVFISRITPVKGVHEAIKIAKYVKKKLIMIGPIIDLEYWRRDVAPYVDNKNCIYLGEVDEDEKVKILRKSLALIFTSRAPDNYPTVLLEALSHGVPIVALYPPHPSGFYDIMNEQFCICGESILDVVENFRRIYSIERKLILRYAKENLSWDSIINRYLLPIFRDIIKGEC